MNYTHCMLKMPHFHQNTIQNLLINPILIKINHTHLFADALHRGFCAERGHVGPDKPVGLASDLFWVDVVGEL